MEAYLQGSGSGLPLHAAWQYMLRTLVPFLVGEAEFGVEAFLMGR